MIEDEVAKEIPSKREIKSKAKSKFSCQTSCSGDEVSNSNPNRTVVI